jgi:hypothetical protein
VTLNKKPPAMGECAAMSAVEKAKSLGIDLSLVDESLRRTPEQRAVEHQRALDMALQLEAAWQARTNDDARTEPAAADTLRL